MTQPCKICHGTGTVECPNQLCAHWCPCTVCNGTGKVEVYEDWEKGFAEEKVRKIPPVKVNTITVGKYEFPVMIDNTLPEGELWLVGKDENSVVRAKVTMERRKRNNGSD